MQTPVRWAIWISGLILLLATTAAAQTPVTISGTVTTRADGASVPGAIVTLVGSNVTAKTDDQGRYSIEVPAALARSGRVQLKIEALGLPAKTYDVELAPNVPTTFDVALSLGFEEQVTVGSRTRGAEVEKAVPVDIITSEQISTSGYVETAQVIQSLAPSFNFPRPTITDGTDTVRPATLRGLGPDQVLVLVNGKRRHQSALVHLNNSVGRGHGRRSQRHSHLGDRADRSPARRGRSPVRIRRHRRRHQHRPQRGGVGTDDHDEVRPVGRQLYRQPVHAERPQLSARRLDRFLRRRALRRGGFVGRAHRQGGADDRRGVPPPQPHESCVVRSPGPDRRGRRRQQPGTATESPVGRSRHARPHDARERERSAEHAADPFLLCVWRREPPRSQQRRLLSPRQRRPQLAGDLPARFLPEIQPTVLDLSATAGVRGAWNDWAWDVSGEYGRNRFDFTIGNSLNVSLGPTIPPNKTEFDAGALALSQIVANADVSRSVRVGALSGPLNVALGTEIRREQYAITAGEPDSYRGGGVPNRAGGVAAIGAQVFPGFRPTNEVDESRSSVAGYVDVEGDFLEWLRLGLAARTEHYSDFGNTLDGKLTVRVQPDRRFVARGSLSTGFRAPSLGQSFFSSTATNFLNVPGQGLVPFESLTLPVNSPAAQVLGAQDLKPENSTHVSAGIAVTPVPRFDVTVDYYRIEIDDRIVLSGNFTGPLITELLAPFGANSARFFTNAIDTRTKGVDITASYRFTLPTAGDLRLHGSYNNTRTKIVGAIATPPQLIGFEQVLFDRIERRRLECSQPHDSIRAGADWRRTRWGANVNVARYGEFCSFTALPADDQTFSPKWLTDAEVSVRLSPQFTFAAGGQNLFNVFADRNITQNSFNGIQTFPSHSPFGMNGRTLYGRIVFKL